MPGAAWGSVQAPAQHGVIGSEGTQEVEAGAAGDSRGAQQQERAQGFGCALPSCSHQQLDVTQTSTALVFTQHFWWQIIESRAEHAPDSADALSNLEKASAREVQHR